MKFNKVVALISAFCFACSLSSCNQKNSSSDSESKGSSADSASQSVSDSETDNSTTTKTTEKLAPDVIMKIGEHDVSVDEYKYYFSFAKISIDQGDKTYWDDDEDDSKLNDLKQQTFNYLFDAYSVYALADENNVSLDEQDKKRVDGKVLAKKIYYNASNAHLNITFDDYLKNTYCTEEVYRKTIERYTLELKTIAALYDEDYRKDNFKNYIRVKYIYVIPQVQYEKDEDGKDTQTTTDFYSLNPLLDYTDEEKSEIAKLNELSRANNAEGIKSELPALMNIILSRLNSGESIDQLMQKYNMDKNVPTNYDGSYQGYYINKSYMGDSFNDAAFALNENDKSGVVSVDGEGYYIIERLPYDEPYLKEELAREYMCDSDYEYGDDYTKLTASIKSKLDVQYSDTYDDITIDYVTIDYDNPEIQANIQNMNEQ